MQPSNAQPRQAALDPTNQGVVLNPGAVNNVAPLVHDGTILVRNKEEIVALRPVRDR